MMIYHIEGKPYQDETGAVVLTLLMFDSDDEKSYQTYSFPDPDKAKIAVDYFKCNIEPLTIEEFNTMLGSGPEWEEYGSKYDG